MKDFRTNGPEVMKFSYSYPKKDGVQRKTNKLVFQTSSSPQSKGESRCIGARKVGIEKIFKIGEHFKDAFSPEFLREFGDKIRN